MDDEDLHLVRPLSWILAAVVIVVLCSIGVIFFDDPRLMISVVFVGLIVSVSPGAVIWFSVGWVRDQRIEKLRWRRQRSSLCVVCGNPVHDADDNCIKCGALISNLRDPLTGHIKRQNELQTRTQRLEQQR